VRALVPIGQRSRGESRVDPDKAGHGENKYGLTAKFAKGEHTVSPQSPWDYVWSEDKHCLTAEIAETAEEKQIGENPIAEPVVTWL
jgi:hypothetical protein